MLPRPCGCLGAYVACPVLRSDGGDAASSHWTRRAPLTTDWLGPIANPVQALGAEGSPGLTAWLGPDAICWSQH